MTHRVAFIKQPNYELNSLEKSIRSAIELSGFDLRTVSGRRVLLKPNMLGAYPPSKGVTTHPDFVLVTAKIFKEAGALVVVGDSANGVHTPERTLAVTEIGKAVERAGVEAISFEASGSENRDGLMISRAPLEADIIINLPKFKTHSLTVLTLAVKNLYGCINGMQKADLHRKYQSIKEFSQVIVKIAEAVHPDLNIIDGITAMEGNGPSGGKLKDLGCVIAGTNMHSVDAACSKLINVDPLEIDTLQVAKNMGLWNEQDTIEITGSTLKDISPEKFDLPSTYIKGQRGSWLFNFIMKRIWSNISAQPVIDKKRCMKCYLCAKACPVSAIMYKENEIPKIKKAECIQCFCCHEICPHKAIDIKSSFFIRVAKFLAERKESTH
ncbi:MAG: DUF362 domain-containing protein [Deltaproteobacteria bacterium]|jgi:uncharacterized protein (DUF362 family)/Pyruvate/2-oxoacid:ferredoxin oxidoreductase delta subunit|nr:DUF362 domain-containing protein [Deltaproteobacteria bacterium]